MKKRITIDDIAKLSGVSKSTVSRVLNNSPGVKEETRKKVLEIVKKYDYIPNIIASGLVKKRINTLGVIVSDITNPYYSVLVKGIEDICRAYGYGLLLCNTDGRVIEEVKHVKLLIQKNVDGIIFASSKLESPALNIMKNNVEYFIFVGRLPSVYEDYDYVVVDNFLGAYMAVNYLISLGHRKIAYLSGTWNTWPNVKRFEGYKKALEDNGLEIDNKYIFNGDFSLEAGYNIGLKVLNMQDRPTAIFCANDMSAIGFLEACWELGFRIPEDISIMGFDDIPLSSFRSIQLTTVSQSIYDQGAFAGKILIEKIQKKHKDKTQIILPPKLVIRKTCAPLL
uniref:LacI family transcriptional regulator n=1 Tax=Dictyoglomus thermophilum TaxID=14 RepID=A0A7V3ZHW1_DICTH